ncbi:MAG: dihydroorotate dehydrogenase electron transfer subunit [Candidatus Omnitrophota bacterium]
MYQIDCKILSNERVQGRYFKLRFSSPRMAKKAAPGQFMEIRVSDANDPLLRKPLGFHRVEGSAIEVLYEAVGKGTEILSKKCAGEKINIIGPLGNGFTLKKPAVFIAGGIGAAPLLFAAQRIKGAKALIGGKDKETLLCQKEFMALGCGVEVATESGERGKKGFVTSLMDKLPKKANLYACGPKAMLREVSRIAQKEKLSCQLLLEEYMACGIGACLGCAVMTKDGYKMVCKDGPVFEAGDIVWD